MRLDSWLARLWCVSTGLFCFVNNHQRRAVAWRQRLNANYVIIYAKFKMFVQRTCGAIQYDMYLTVSDSGGGQNFWVEINKKFQKWKGVCFTHTLSLVVIWSWEGEGNFYMVGFYFKNMFEFVTLGACLHGIPLYRFSRGNLLGLAQAAFIRIFLLNTCLLQLRRLRLWNDNIGQQNWTFFGAFHESIFIR